MNFDVVQRKRVSVAYKEELPVRTNTTAEECERACAGNCSCWGTAFNGANGYCYVIDLPVETMVYEADDRKVGYFKVRRVAASARSSCMSPGVAAATAALSLVQVGLAVAGAYIGYRLWERRKRKRAETGAAGGQGAEADAAGGQGAEAGACRVAAWPARQPVRARRQLQPCPRPKPP